MATPEWKESAYKAVWESGYLTDDATVNARIWRAVELALRTARPEPSEVSDWGKYTMPPDLAPPPVPVTP